MKHMSPEQPAPLAGFTVAVTAARRADEIGGLLARRGAAVLHAPALRIIPLADDSDRSSQLRETLRAYMQAGGRKSGAAALLGLHEKTVAYRLRNAEAALGGHERAYRADVSAALLVHAALRPGESPP